MGKYRKKPVVIEAFHHTDDKTTKDFYEFTGGYNECFTRGLCGEIYIKTPEGTMIAFPGDYIIKGVQGEFYPCKPYIFQATYERVDD